MIKPLIYGAVVALYVFQTAHVPAAPAKAHTPAHLATVHN